MGVDADKAYVAGTLQIYLNCGKQVTQDRKFLILSGMDENWLPFSKDDKPLFLLTLPVNSNIMAESEVAASIYSLYVCI